jgi:hypothetical protein
VRFPGGEVFLESKKKKSYLKGEEKKLLETHYHFTVDNAYHQKTLLRQSKSHCKKVHDIKKNPHGSLEQHCRKKKKRKDIQSINLI